MKTQFQTRYPGRRTSLAMAAAMLMGAAPHAHGIDTQVSGRINFGAVYRTQARDPLLLTTLNASAIGLAGRGTGGNADDGNTNYDRGDAVSRAVKAYIDFAAREGDFSALVRLKAWHDFGLLDDGRPWGNSASHYTAGAPLSDRGAGVLTRFSGVAFQEAWVQERFQLGDAQLTARAGQQDLAWGSRFFTPGGLEELNPRDLPAMHRAGSVPQETKVAMPMLFGHLDLTPAIAIESYYQTAFRATALDMCGTIWAMSDYLAGGCDVTMSGQPLVSDRARLPLGAVMHRLPTPKPGPAEFGVALLFKPMPDTEVGLYHARYNSRILMPGLRRTTRAAGFPALIAGNPDGKNMAYFTEYPEGLAITALSFAHQRGRTNFYGEVSYRPRVPFMLSPGDVLPPFLSPTAPALLRASADAVAPGGIFHGFDFQKLEQVQLGVQHAFEAGGLGLAAGAELVAKHSPGLPDQAVRRYGRTDIYGTGPVLGNCSGTGSDPVRQCSLRGYASANAYGYRLRLNARLPALAQGLATSAGLAFAHDVKGWSGDFLLNEGRKTAVLSLRFEYLKRYLADIAYMPNWGGDYNAASDRDTLALSVGIKF